MGASELPDQSWVHGLSFLTLQGVDIRHNKDRKVRRKEPKSQDIYLRLLVKVRLRPETLAASRTGVLVLGPGLLQGPAGQAHICGSAQGFWRFNVFSLWAAYSSGRGREFGGLSAAQWDGGKAIKTLPTQTMFVFQLKVVGEGCGLPWVPIPFLSSSSTGFWPDEPTLPLTKSC